jgi:hypothetical protein
MTPLLIVGGVVTVMAAIGYLAYRFEQKRVEALRQVAAELKFDFFPHGDSRFQRELDGFHLFDQGRARTIRNLMRGTTADLDVAVFDYSYLTGSGKHRHTWRQTVACFRFDRGRLPSFSLRPESVFHKVGAWLGYQDFDFASHPTFSKKYLLRGRDEEAVRRLFPDAVLEFFEERRGLCVEGAGGRLLMYRHAVRVDPAAVRSFLEEAFGVLAQFRPAARDKV